MDVLAVLNTWAKEFESLVQLLMLVAVSAATITALWSTWRARADTRIRVEYICEIREVFTPDVQNAAWGGDYRRSHSTVTAMLTNTGLRPTGIPWFGFGLIIPFTNASAVLQPITDYRAEGVLPLEAGKRLTIELRPPEQLREEILGFGIKWFPRFRIKRLRLTVATEGDDVFRAKIGKKLRAHIRETASKTNWIYQCTKVTEASHKS